MTIEEQVKIEFIRSEFYGAWNLEELKKRKDFCLKHCRNLKAIIIYYQLAKIMLTDHNEKEMLRLINLAELLFKET